MDDHELSDQLHELQRRLVEQRDLEAIKQLKARYCRLVDTKDWEGWVDECLTDDVHLDIVGTIREGRDDALAMMHETLTGGSTVHHVYTPEITFTGPDSATGVWAMEDLVRTVGDRARAFHGYGHYHETYVRTERGWRIATTRLTRLRVDRIVD
jgi:uncharacterized protein (TIGR02246 family)